MRAAVDRINAHEVLPRLGPKPSGSLNQLRNHGHIQSHTASAWLVSDRTGWKLPRLRVCTFRGRLTLGMALVLQYKCGTFQR